MHIVSQKETQLISWSTRLAFQRQVSRTSVQQSKPAHWLLDVEKKNRIVNSILYSP
jgi:hypothetical protein